MRFFQHFTLGRPKPLDRLKEVQIGVNNKRAHVPILIIDDRVFPHERKLRRHDFNITKVDDIEDIKAISEYGVVLCDIQGVGVKFDEEYEGAHLIREISRRYPEKIVIAYTAHQFDAGYNEFFQMADMIIKKDTPWDEWLNHIDDAIDHRLDPVEQWYRLRDHLIRQENISMYTALKVEQGYISAIENRDEETLINRTEQSELSGETKKLVIEACSLLFSIIS